MDENSVILNQGKKNGNEPSKVWMDIKKVLCIRMDSLGDVLMTTPALRAIKESRPGIHLTLLTSQAGSRITPLIPEVDQVIPYNAPWMKATKARLDSSLEHQMIAKLNQGRYDAAIIFSVFTQNPLPAALMAYLANIPLRLAYCRENPYQLLTDWCPETDLVLDAHMRHEVQRQLDLVASVGFTTRNENLSVQIPEGTLDDLKVVLPRLGLELEHPWLVVHPGASAPSRRYPMEGFAEVARRLVKDHGFQVVFTGSGWEQKLVKEIQAKMQAPSISLVNKLDLTGLAGLLSLSPLLIANNTGPVHIAAALGTPIVDIYALTNPQHTPWNAPHRVLSHDVPCRYCLKSVCPLEHHACLRKVTPAQVVEAVLDLLANPNAAVSLPSAEIGHVSSMNTE